MKAFKTILFSLPVLFILWIVGMFNGLKLVPFIIEDYYVNDHGLDHPMSLMLERDHELNVEISGIDNDTVVVILDLFPNTMDTLHKLNLNKLRADVIANEKKLDTIYHYVYSSFGQEKSLASITNFPFGLVDSASTYVETRYVYDLNNLKKFTLEIDADYLLDNVPRTYHQSFEVIRTRKLRWQGMRWGGKW